MKKTCMLLLALILSLYFTACSAPVSPSVTLGTTNAPQTASTPAATIAAPSVTVEPTIAPTPAPTPFGEEPEHAGSGEVLFDIYQHTALVDLNKDGVPEQLTFNAGESSSTLQINENTYTIDRERQAQLFAVTDVDVSDSTLELAFTDKYDSSLADTEYPFTYLYWWNGTELKRMGGLMNMKFDGAWRSGFNAADNFDGRGTVMCLTNTQEFSDAWYTGHYVPDGADRQLKEDAYAAPVLFNQEPLTLKNYILLLKNITNDYFEESYNVIWDYASGSGGYDVKPRDYSDDVVAFIPQAGEHLTIVKVYGKKWFKLRASDGKQGWLKCDDGKVFNYWSVMQYTAQDLFDGIVTAG